MPGMFDGWDEKRARAERPAAPAPAAPVDPGRASAYALAALEGEVANLLSVPVGAGRNDQLNKSAVKMYGYAAAGAIDEHLVTETLGGADGGLDYPATRKTLQSARDAVYGRLGARTIPEPTTPVREVPPWEQSDDPLDDNYVPPPPAPSNAQATGSHAESTSTDGTTASPAGNASDASDSSQTTTTPDPLLVLEVGKVRRAREARRQVDHEDAVAAFREPPYTASLTAELAMPPQPTRYAVDRVIPAGGNVLLTAQYKTGKTTLISNLARSLVDGHPFLGRYDVAAVDGRVAIFNYEVDRDQYREWLRDLNIDDTDRVVPLNLRGYRLPLEVPFVEDWVVAWLQRHEARVWIVDPFARAATGIDENSNTEVGRWLDTLDVIKARAGVTELVLPTHTGRREADDGDERARGATRLDDWADVRWLLTKDKGDVRYFRATGRDVDEAESALAYDPATRGLTLTGGSRGENDRQRVRTAVLTVIREFPGVGTEDLKTRVRGVRKERVAGAVDELLEAGEIHTRHESAGRGRPRLAHYPGRHPDSVFPGVRHPTSDPLVGPV